MNLQQLCLPATSMLRPVPHTAVCLTVCAPPPILSPAPLLPQNNNRPISSLIGQDAWTVAMNAGIFLHCIIAYQVNVNVWCSLLLHVTVPK